MSFNRRPEQQLFVFIAVSELIFLFYLIDNRRVPELCGGTTSWFNKPHDSHGARSVYDMGVSTNRSGDTA